MRPTYCINGAKRTTVRNAKKWDNSAVLYGTYNGFPLAPSEKGFQKYSNHLRKT